MNRWVQKSDKGDHWKKLVTNNVNSRKFISKNAKKGLTLSKASIRVLTTY
jgi:hypothetical protein